MKRLKPLRFMFKHSYSWVTQSRELLQLLMLLEMNHVF